MHSLHLLSQLDLHAEYKQDKKVLTINRIDLIHILKQYEIKVRQKQPPPYGLSIPDLLKEREKDNLA